MDEKTIQRIKKLQALAERGVGDEKTTAQKKLAKLLKDNGINSLDELQKEEYEYTIFSYNGKHEIKLLRQCMYKVMGAKSDRTAYKPYGRRQKIGIYCTKAQKIEIELEFEFYRNVFYEELSTFMDAFIQAQKIFTEDAPVGDYDEFNERDMKIAFMATGIERRSRVVVIQKDGTLYAFTQFFMPRGRLEYLQATDGVPYDIFVKKGLITLSGENYVDYHDVYGWFTMLLEDYGIRPLKIGYDRYSAQYLITDMANYGFHMDDVYQGENLTPVIREFEGIIKDGDFKIADNNLLKTHFLNVALKHNMETRKFRPIKIEQRAHIDGFVSVIDAMTVRQKYWEECGELLKNAA